MVLAALGWLGVASNLQATEIVIYGFEGSLEGWGIPDWAKSSSDYVAKDVVSSPDVANEGQHALKFWAAFPGNRWTGAYVERLLEVNDWTTFGRLSVSVYLPPGAPEGLQGRIILTVGDEWKWTEMNRTIALIPGAWTTLTVNLKPGSMDWKFFPDEQFRGRVDKIGLRIESDTAGPAYHGPIFVDNVQLTE